jgi:hypothetical protein
MTPLQITLLIMSPYIVGFVALTALGNPIKRPKA